MVKQIVSGVKLENTTWRWSLNYVEQVSYSASYHLKILIIIILKTRDMTSILLIFWIPSAFQMFKEFILKSLKRSIHEVFDRTWRLWSTQTF